MLVGVRGVQLIQRKRVPRLFGCIVGDVLSSADSARSWLVFLEGSQKCAERQSAVPYRVEGKLGTDET